MRNDDTEALSYVRDVLRVFAMKNRVLCLDGTSCCKKTSICAEILKHKAFACVGDATICDNTRNGERVLRVDRRNSRDRHANGDDDDDDICRPAKVSRGGGGVETRIVVDSATRDHTLKVQKYRRIVRPNTYFVSNLGYICGGMLDVNRVHVDLSAASNENGAFIAIMDRSPLNVEEWRLLWILMDEYLDLFGNAVVDESPQSAQRGFLARFDDAFLSLRKCTWYRYFRSRLDVLAFIDSNVQRCDRIRAQRNRGSDGERAAWRFYTALQNRMYVQLYRALDAREMRDFPYVERIDGHDRAYLTRDSYIDLAMMDLPPAAASSPSQSSDDRADGTRHVRLLAAELRSMMAANWTSTYRARRDDRAAITTATTTNGNVDDNRATMLKFYLPSPSKYADCCDPVEGLYNAHVYREVGRALVKHSRNGDLPAHIDTVPEDLTRVASTSQLSPLYAQICSRFRPVIAQQRSADQVYNEHDNVEALAMEIATSDCDYDYHTIDE